MWRALTAFSGSREIAHDAVAEAFAQAAGRGDAIRSPERWVWKAAYRIAAGELKQRGGVLPLSGDAPIVDNEPAWELRAALGCLPSRQRAALVLHYYAGYSAGEIAWMVGSTPGGVWMSLSRGRRRLREVLEGDDV
jgi:RNA polymerase sigma-70 factor (ECF subfamily)